jgi:hypothetical protein
MQVCFPGALLFGVIGLYHDRRKALAAIGTVVGLIGAPFVVLGLLLQLLGL